MFNFSIEIPRSRGNLSQAQRQNISVFGRESQKIGQKNNQNVPGADLGFSRGGGADFQKIFQNFDDLFFFRSTKSIFRALPKHYFALILAKFSAPQAKFLKNC